MRAATQARAWRQETLVRRTRWQAADIKLADGQLNLARQALCLQAGESFGGVDDDIRFGCAESGSAKQDQGEAEVTKQHAAILPDSPLAWPSLAASFADCLAALAKNARQKAGPVVWHGACF